MARFFEIYFFTCVCDGVDAAHGTHAHGQRHGQIDVVNDRARQDLGIAARRLDPVGRLAQDGRHLAARVRRGDRDVVEPRADADGLAQPGRAAAADGHDAVGAVGLGVRDGRVGDAGGRVHGGTAKDARDVAAEDLAEVVGLADLLWGGEEEGLGEVLPRELGGQFLDGAAAKDDPAGVGVVLEVHGEG